MPTISSYRSQRPFSAVAITVAVAMLVTAVGLSVLAPRPVAIVPEPQPVLTPALTLAPTAVPTPSPTPTPIPTPTPTATPENKPGQPGTCLILEQKYCGTGDKVLGFHAGFNIPAGVPLFAPFDGYIISSSGKFSQSGGDYHQVGVYVSPDGNYQKSTLLVDLTPAEPIVSSGPVKKGQLIGKTTGTVVSEAGGRNLLVSASTAYGLPDTGFEKSLLEKLLTKI